MPPVRRSRRLRRQDVEEDGAPYDCFICLTSITVNMYNATATPCCTRRVHLACYQQHVHTSAACGHCRRPFAAQAAIDPIRNPPINEDLARREAQRQQARFGSIASTWSARSQDSTGMCVFYFTNRCLREHFKKKILKN